MGHKLCLNLRGGRQRIVIIQLEPEPDGGFPLGRGLRVASPQASDSIAACRPADYQVYRRHTQLIQPKFQHILHRRSTGTFMVRRPSRRRHDTKSPNISWCANGVAARITRFQWQRGIFGSCRGISRQGFVCPRSTDLPRFAICFLGSSDGIRMVRSALQCRWEMRRCTPWCPKGFHEVGVGLDEHHDRNKPNQT